MSSEGSTGWGPEMQGGLAEASLVVYRVGAHTQQYNVQEARVAMPSLTRVHAWMLAPAASTRVKLVSTAGVCLFGRRCHHSVAIGRHSMNLG